MRTGKQDPLLCKNTDRLESGFCRLVIVKEVDINSDIEGWKNEEGGSPYVNDISHHRLPEGSPPLFS